MNITATTTTTTAPESKHLEELGQQLEEQDRRSKAQELHFLIEGELETEEIC